MPRGVYKRTKKIKKVSQFYKNVEEIREFMGKNNIKLLELLKYLKRRNHKDEDN